MNHLTGKLLAVDIIAEHSYKSATGKYNGFDVVVTNGNKYVGLIRVKMDMVPRLCTY